jgi:hypothetical protein
MMTLKEGLVHVNRVRRCAGGWIARCPAHDDHTPSLSIRRGDQGKVLFKFLAGCRYEKHHRRTRRAALVEPAEAE